MGIGSFIRKNFIDVIEWENSAQEVLAWQFPMQDAEIQNGASLTVRESQMAVFVNEGKLADVFGPGRYTLTTKTLPLLTNLMNWDKLFESPFKSDVYFFSTRIQTGRKWGTTQAITIRDKDFDMVRVRAFGMYSYRISEAKKFFTELSGARELYTREDLEGQLLGIMLATLATALGESKLAFLDMAANQALMAQQVRSPLTVAMQRYGLELDEFTVANVSLPEELQTALDERIAAGMKGGVSTAKLSGFTQYQIANAIPDIAKNEGGVAGLGAGLASGMAFGQILSQGVAQALQGNTSSSPSPAEPEDSVEVRLEKLKSLLDKGLISQADYDTAKAELLKKLLG